MRKKILKKWFLFLSVALAPIFWSAYSFAQGNNDITVARPLLILGSLTALSLVPVLAVLTTSFIKIVVVFGLLRTAMGTQQIPPNQVVTGLAMILTVYVMAPVGLEMKREAESVMQKQTNQGLMSEASLNIIMEGLQKSKEPFRKFLIKHAHTKNRLLFLKLAKKLRQPKDRIELTNRDFLVLVPAFIISELTEAFYIGFMIFLPFLVIDMVVANILLSLGMFQLSPVTVSLPFKILLFVLIDGWSLITGGLIEGYI